MNPARILRPTAGSMKLMTKKMLITVVIVVSGFLFLGNGTSQADEEAAKIMVGHAIQQDLNLISMFPASISIASAGEVQEAGLASFALKLGLKCHFGSDSVLICGDATVDASSLGSRISCQGASEPFSCSFHEVDIRDLLRLIHKNTGLNVICSKVVRGRLTVRTSKLAAGTLVDGVVRAVGLELKQQGNIVFIGEGKQLAEMLPPLEENASGLTASGLISLDFRDMDIRDVAKTIAHRFSRDFASGANVRGNVTIALKNVRESEAMTGLARANGFDVEMVDGVWILADPRELGGLIESWKAPVPEPATNISLDFRDTRVQALVQIVSDKGGLPYPALLNPEARVTVRFENRPADRVQNLLLKLGGGTL